MFRSGILAFITASVLLLQGCSGGSSGSNNEPTPSANPPTGSTPPPANNFDADPIENDAAPISFVAWLGADDAEVQFSEQGDGYELFSSRQLDCNIAAHTSCDSGQRQSLNSSELGVSALNLSGESYFVLKDGELQSRPKRYPAIENYGFGDFYGSAISYSFKGRFFVYSLSERGAYSTIDGVSWKFEGEKNVTDTQAPGFILGEGVQFIEHKNKLWAIGDTGTGGWVNAVWSSTDGATWTLETEAADFTGRRDHKVISFQEKIWVIGGRRQYNRNDVWSSEDGISWTEETGNAAFTPRSYHHVLVYENRLWLVGGAKRQDEPGETNDIWSSENGRNWTLEAELDEQMHAELFEDNIIEERNSSNAFMNDDKLQIVTDSAIRSEFLNVDFSVEANYNLARVRWESENGRDWQRIEHPTDELFEGLVTQASDGILWAMAGPPRNHFFLSPPYYRNGYSVRRSENGYDWSGYSDTAEFLPRTRHYTAFSQGKWWATAGVYPRRILNNTWTSTNGIDWTSAAADSNAPPCVDAAHTVFQNRLWRIGGSCAAEDETAQRSNAVWYTEDGGSWVQATAAAAFPPLSNHKAVSYKGKMFVVGGSTNAGRTNAVWSSSDGENWAQETSNAGFSPRRFHALAVHNGKLWLAGGEGAVPIDEDNTWATVEPTAEVWSSEDGANWFQETQNAGFTPRRHLQLTSHEGKLFVVGGTHRHPTWNEDSDFSASPWQTTNDVWSSTDGVNWTEETASATFGRRQYHQLVSNDGYLWLFGGEDYDFGGDDGNEPPPSRIRDYRDVWRSKDGKTWRKLLKSSIGFK